MVAGRAGAALTNEAAYQDIVTSDLPEWNQDASLIDWLTNL